MFLNRSSIKLTNIRLYYALYRIFRYDSFCAWRALLAINIKRRNFYVFYLRSLVGNDDCNIISSSRGSESEFSNAQEALSSNLGGGIVLMNFLWCHGIYSQNEAEAKSASWQFLIVYIFFYEVLRFFWNLAHLKIKWNKLRNFRVLWRHFFFWKKINF